MTKTCDNNNVSQTVMSLNSENTSSNQNGHNLSHSSANFIESTECKSSTTNLFNVYLLVNTEQVKLVSIYFIILKRF